MPRARLTAPNVHYEVQVLSNLLTYATVSTHPSERYARNKATCRSFANLPCRIVRCEVIATYTNRERPTTS